MKNLYSSLFQMWTRINKENNVDVYPLNLIDGLRKVDEYYKVVPSSAFDEVLNPTAEEPVAT